MKKCNVLKFKNSFLVFLCIGMLNNVISFAQTEATIKVYKKTFTTYPFSDPNPIPSFTKYYPYYRFDGYTNESIQKQWTVVELENEYIKVLILPEIGGKIWTAINKKTNQPYLYNNQVVKFRDVAMRGPWTSGGIESNYGIFGHTPNCATPVDYTTITKKDGSVSCVIGVLDLITRTPWRIDINLPNDKAYFTTNSLWFNATSMDEPYYHWMNAGLKASGQLEFIYPGQNFIGHEGEVGEWPFNNERKRDIKLYDQNDFTGYHSYHVFGTYTNFFGAYYHEDQNGMVRYASHDDKAGKKIWIWGLSRAGMIWEQLLTDKDGQYVEVQSGRLFNQSAENSTFSPFKHKSFAPMSTDQWKEFWYPVGAINGIKEANEYGAFNIEEKGKYIHFYFNPVVKIKDSFVIKVGNQVVKKALLNLLPLQLYHDSIETSQDNIECRIGKNLFNYVSSITQNLERPITMPDRFDWNSSYGLYIQGKEFLDQRMYAKASLKLDSSLIKDPFFIPALVKKASIQYFNFEYQQALTTIKTALSIDTYDGAANYYYGLIQLALGSTINARDGFDIASLSVEYRAAAFTSIAKMYLKQSDAGQAILYANKALNYNKLNLNALQVKAVAYRKKNDLPNHQLILKELLELDPLNHFSNFENAYVGLKNYTSFTQLIQNEQPIETYLELACQYQDLNCSEEAIQLLELVSEHPMSNYMEAYLLRSTNPAKSKALMDLAHSKSIDFILPFRQEFEPILKWAVSSSHHWKASYYLALLEQSREHLLAAKKLLTEVGNLPDQAIFYATRFNVQDPSSTLQNDIDKAILLDPENWRYTKTKTQLLQKQGDYTSAMQTAQAYYKLHPKNYIMGLELAKQGLYAKDFLIVDSILKNINIIPFEGATESRELYRETKIHLAIHSMSQHKFKEAIQYLNTSLLWPENLGVGAPYADEIDCRIEYYLLINCFQKLKNSVEITRYKKLLSSFNSNKFKEPVGTLLQSAFELDTTNFEKRATDLIQSQFNVPLHEKRSSIRMLIHLLGGF